MPIDELAAWRLRVHMLIEAVRLWPDDTIGYLGFTGQSNLGDEAIFTALRSALDPLRLLPIPRGYNAVRIAGAIRKRPLGTLWLGGGTLVGRRRWLERLSAARDSLQPRLLVTLGVGVEDPTDPRFSRLTDRRELQEWARLIPRFERFSVRGPHSAEVLAEFGLQVRSIGDPAFLLDVPGGVPAYGQRSDTIAVNVGLHEVTWSDDPEVHLARLVPPLKRASQRGTTTIVLAFRDTDREICNKLAQQIPGAKVIDVFRDPPYALALLAGSRIAITQRLHAAVFAALTGTPCLILEYRPKIQDVVRLLGTGATWVRIDRLTENDVEDLLHIDDDTWNRRHHSLMASVQLAREDLQIELRELRTTLDA